MNVVFDDTTELTDEALLVRYGNGDLVAARMLTARLTPRLMGYSARVLGDRSEAEDVVQETMLRLWKIAGDWRQGESKVSTWAYRVTMNLCTDRLRKTKPVTLDAIAEPEDDALSAEQQLQRNARVSALYGALAELPERQAQALSLRHIDEMSNPDIAQTMGVQVRAVESLIARGKRALAKALAGRKDELGFTDDGH